MKSGVHSKKAVDHNGNHFLLGGKQELPFELILGDADDTEFLRLKRNGSIDPEGNFLHRKLSGHCCKALRPVPPSFRFRPESIPCSPVLPDSA